jgi:hypothetical protein
MNEGNIAISAAGGPERSVPAVAASVNVFTSYSRRNRPFARRLHVDLTRAGLCPWLDEHGIAHDSPDWDAEIGSAIRRCDRFVLLTSPESAKSDNVAREVREAEAAGKPITTLNVAGAIADLPAAWRQRHVTAVPVGGYPAALAHLLPRLGATGTLPETLDTLLNGPPRTAGEAAAVLGGVPPVAVPGFAWLPVWPSGYGMVWLVGPVDAPLVRPDPVAVLFQHTGPRVGRIEQVVRAWAAEAAQVSATPWLVVVAGPQDEHEQNYSLNTRTHLHQLRDTVEAGSRALDQFATGRRLALYFNTLVPIAFEIGSEARNMFRQRRVYHYRTTGDGYDLVYAGW